MKMKNGAEKTCAIFFAGNQTKKGFFYSVNVVGKGRCAALLRSVPWSDGFGIIDRP